jgi:hypothetical protein
MTVTVGETGDIQLSGRCGVEDAETLLARLSDRPGATVDWRSCEGAHAAVVQVLLAARPPLRGPPADSFLASWVEPQLGKG